MCLNKVIESYSPPLEKEIIAWKLIRVDPTTKEITFPYQSNVQVKFNEWMEAVNISIYCSLYFEIGQPQCAPELLHYITGFHTFKTRKDAREAKKEFSKNHYHIVKVKIKDITYLGDDGTSTSIYWISKKIQNYVSNKIMFIEEPKNARNAKAL